MLVLHPQVKVIEGTGNDGYTKTVHNFGCTPHALGEHH